MQSKIVKCCTHPSRNSSAWPPHRPTPASAECSAPVTTVRVHFFKFIFVFIHLFYQFILLLINCNFNFAFQLVFLHQTRFLADDKPGTYSTNQGVMYVNYVCLL
jgi:hypothetical protein